MEKGTQLQVKALEVKVSLNHLKNLDRCVHVPDYKQSGTKARRRGEDIKCGAQVVS
jgi:hypothetical protein